MTNLNNSKDNTKLFRVLVYGIERLNFQTPSDKIVTNNIEITFAPFDTELKFQDFDGVILFQGIWAKWKTNNSMYADHEPYLIDVQNDMLRARVKQLQALLKKNGFIAFLMNSMTQEDFDLAKEVLEWYPNTYFKPIRDNEFIRKIYFNELKKYFDSDYGVAKTIFMHYGDYDYRKIAEISNYEGDVSICVDSKIFYLPCHPIKKDEKNVLDLFNTLTPGLIATYKKLKQELPDWVNDFKFQTENKYIGELVKIKERFELISNEILIFQDFKKPLILSGTLLAESIVNLMKNGMKLAVTGKDVGLEDLQLWDKPEQEKGSIIAVIEVKGLNDNVSREAINQVDDHKERNNFKETFPGVLIANTFIKSSNSIANKDKPIENEQIKHAVNMNVLILRTLDLLRAYNMILEGVTTAEDFQNYLLTKKGWLEVKDNNFILHD